MPDDQFVVLARKEIERDDVKLSYELVVSRQEAPFEQHVAETGNEFRIQPFVRLVRVDS